MSNAVISTPTMSIKFSSDDYVDFFKGPVKVGPRGRVQWTSSIGPSSPLMKNGTSSVNSPTPGAIPPSGYLIK